MVDYALYQADRENSDTSMKFHETRQLYSKLIHLLFTHTKVGLNFLGFSIAGTRVLLDRVV